MEGVPTQRCPHCEQTYPRSKEYWKLDKRTADGMGPTCRSCAKEILRDWKIRTGRLRLDDQARAVRKRTSKYAADEGTCSVCGQTFPRTPEFWHKGKNVDGLNSACRACACAVAQQWHAAHPGRKVLHPETGQPVSRHSLRMYRAREKCLAHYGGSPPHCACCGETHREFLAIDHIGGGGNKHIKSLPSRRLTPWLVRNNFPQVFRVLCHNCNRSLGIYGYCPHNRERPLPDDAAH